ncbi:TRAP transporter small permease [Virgibacillus alimentarius]|uniref:TRAP transporter small permease n=1 Tax=Virgibacillus alimentarius TaxID=698769 RepID=UPI0004939BF7|nr:TRAP transporter small permease [Virgibacillus alimentarius]
MSKALLYVEYTILASSMAIMAIITFANVLSRFFFGLSLSFTEEVTINLFVLLTFVGASVGIYKGAHLGFNLLYEKANNVNKVISSIFVGAVIAFFFFVVAYHGLDIVSAQWERGQTTPALGWPQWVFSSAVPFGAVLCIIRTIESTVKSIISIKNESVNES